MSLRGRRWHGVPWCAPAPARPAAAAGARGLAAQPALAAVRVSLTRQRLPSISTGLRPARRECRFTSVNHDSSRRRARRVRPVRAARIAPRAELRNQMRRTVRETVRVAILDAAEELIARHGLHDAALVQIAKRAGVAVGTLYNYFTDRDALIRALFESRRATLRPRLLAAIDAGRDLAFEPRLRRFVRDLFEAFESHRSFLKLAIENEHLKPSRSTMPQDLAAGVRDIVAAGVREGAIRVDNADLLTLAITATIKSVMVHRIRAGGELVGDAGAIVDFVLDGARRAAR
jgi:AcrR family transcriptional regulator